MIILHFQNELCQLAEAVVDSFCFIVHLPKGKKVPFDRLREWVSRGGSLYCGWLTVRSFDGFTVNFSEWCVYLCIQKMQGAKKKSPSIITQTIGSLRELVLKKDLLQILLYCFPYPQTKRSDIAGYHSNNNLIKASLMALYTVNFSYLHCTWIRAISDRIYKMLTCKATYHSSKWSKHVQQWSFVWEHCCRITDGECQ